jgi:hypothetical protein
MINDANSKSLLCRRIIDRRREGAQIEGGSGKNIKEPLCSQFGRTEHRSFFR